MNYICQVSPQERKTFSAFVFSVVQSDKTVTIIKSGTSTTNLSLTVIFLSRPLFKMRSRKDFLLKVMSAL